MSVGTLKARELAKKKKSGFLLDDTWMMNDEQSKCICGELIKVLLYLLFL